MCLKCGHCGCGSGSKHAEQHSINRKSDVHDLALNLTIWTVWWVFTLFLFNENYLNILTNKFSTAFNLGVINVM
mgnify:CR=1 FL=1